jgi:hypothetical protein
MAKPKLPKLLISKIYKTGQTRGADDDQIFQNRVGRNSTALFPFRIFVQHPELRKVEFENGKIVFLSPLDFFENISKGELNSLGLKLGFNCLVFYQTRDDWNNWNPKKNGLNIAKSRIAPLKGEYVARIANTTAEADKRINEGYTTSGIKGAGIRGFEYCSSSTLKECRVQLEALFWHATDSKDILVGEGMSAAEIVTMKSLSIANAGLTNLLDYNVLKENRILNSNHELICPLCLENLSAAGLLNRMKQAAGREVHDLTVTEVNLFHIQELRYGVFNHRPYNLGWGHHHCNVVCKDSGIAETIKWMEKVVMRNQKIKS